MLCFKFRYFSNLVLIATIFLVCSSTLYASVIIDDDFESVNTEWNLLVNSNNQALGNFDHSFISPFDYSDNVARIDITDGGINNYDIQLFQSNFSINVGGEYHISFSAWVEQGPKEIEVQLLQHSSPYTNYGIKTVTLSETPKNFLLSFSVQTNEPTDARLRFRLGGEEKVVYLDDVIFIKEPRTINLETVILKLDDLRDNEENIVNFRAAIDAISYRGLKASIGIVGRDFIDFESRVSFQDYMQELAINNDIEIWNHGWNHYRKDDNTWWEFRGPDPDHQRNHIIDTQRAVFSALGITMKSFGAPFNQTDEATCEAMANVDDIVVWILPKTCEAGFGDKTVLRERVNFEISSGDVDLPHFLRFYGDEVRRDSDHIILQGHPGFWGADELSDFEQILDLLINRGHSFETPYSYHLTQ